MTFQKPSAQMLFFRGSLIRLSCWPNFWINPRPGCVCVALGKAHDVPLSVLLHLERGDLWSCVVFRCLVFRAGCESLRAKWQGSGGLAAEEKEMKRVTLHIVTAKARDHTEEPWESQTTGPLSAYNRDRSATAFEKRVHLLWLPSVERGLSSSPADSCGFDYWLGQTGDLGLQLQYSGQGVRGLAKTRIAGGCHMLAKLHAVHAASNSIQQDLLRASIYPATFHGCEPTLPSSDELSRIRSKVFAALLGRAPSATVVISCCVDLGPWIFGLG